MQALPSLSHTQPQRHSSARHGSILIHLMGYFLRYPHIRKTPCMCLSCGAALKRLYDVSTNAILSRPMVTSHCAIPTHIWYTQWSLLSRKGKSSSSGSSLGACRDLYFHKHSVMHSIHDAASFIYVWKLKLHLLLGVPMHVTLR